MDIDNCYATAGYYRIHSNYRDTLDLRDFFLLYI